MKIQPFQVAFPDFSAVDNPDTFCDQIKYNFREHLENGLYRQPARKAFYLYKIEFGGRKHLGLVTLNDVEDFFAGKVKKHEHTLSEKERQHMDLILHWQAVLKPVLLTYPAVPAIQEWMQAYVRHHHAIFNTRFGKGHVHRVWMIAQPGDIAELQQLFEQHVREAYIADGHHRTTTMALLHEQKARFPEMDLDHLFCAFFANDQLDILDYNRAVEALRTLTPLQFMARLARVFDIEPLEAPRKPRQKHELVLFIRREWFSLRWKPEVLVRYPDDQVLFDASLLNDWVLRDMLGVEDVRSDDRIAYIEGSKGLRGVEKACGGGKTHVGFVLYPVSFDSLIRVADAGGSLPPKSTYFAPRLKSGVLVHLLKRAVPSVAKAGG